MNPSEAARARLEAIVDRGVEAHQLLLSVMPQEHVASSLPRLEALVRLGIEAEVALARIRAVERGGR